jgi:error-prone DNA polymerase
LHTVPPEDPLVYDMICRADTVGVFQIESRAQMSMLPRLRPRCFYDLVIEVAIVRPGPIQGDMVHPYLRRRNGEEPVTYPDERVKRVLGKTLGVPLFQEQAMALAIVAAGFTPGEADKLRRAMAAWKRSGDLIRLFGEKIVTGMTAQGYSRDFAERCFQQIKGFSEYGFPESHAASFALLVYVSAWLKRHHPAAFAAALINSQPMGFYAPAQIVRDAQEHGVEVRPIDVNMSGWDCRLEEGTKGRRDKGTEGFGDVLPQSLSPLVPPSLRLGTRLIKGMREDDARAVENAVAQHGPFDSIEALWRSSGVRVQALRKLAQADAFQSMNLDRQHALWHVQALKDERLPMFDQDRHEGTEARRDEGAEGSENALPQSLCPSVPLSLHSSALSTQHPELAPSLPAIPPLRKVIQDFSTTGLSLRPHPVSFIRDELERRKVIPASELKEERKTRTGRQVRVGGMVLVRQRPSTAKGIVFMTLEDETGVANVIVRPEVYEKFRRAARHGVVIIASGKVERQGEVVHVLVSHIEDIGHTLAGLTRTSRDFH